MLFNRFRSKDEPAIEDLESLVLKFGSQVDVSRDQPVSNLADKLAGAFMTLGGKPPSVR